MFIIFIHMDIYKDIYFRKQDELSLYFYVSAVTTKKKKSNVITWDTFTVQGVPQNITVGE